MRKAAYKYFAVLERR